MVKYFLAFKVSISIVHVPSSMGQLVILYNSIDIVTHIDVSRLPKRCKIQNYGQIHIA